MPRGYDRRDGRVTRGVASRGGAVEATATAKSEAAGEERRRRVPRAARGRVHRDGVLLRVDVGAVAIASRPGQHPGARHRHQRPRAASAATRAAAPHAPTPPPSPRRPCRPATARALAVPTAPAERAPGERVERPGVGQRVLPPRWALRPRALAPAVTTPASRSARCPARRSPSPRTRTGATACPGAASARPGGCRTRGGPGGTAPSCPCAGSGSPTP